MAIVPKFEFKGQYLFQTTINVRFLDLNAGNHLSNHMYLDYLTEVMCQYFAYHGMTLDNIFGYAQVFSSVYVDYKREVGYPEQLLFRMGVHTVTKSKVIFYVNSINANDKQTHEALIETAYINRQTNRPGRIPSSLHDLLKSI